METLKIQFRFFNFFVSDNSDFLIILEKENCSVLDSTISSLNYTGCTGCIQGVYRVYQNMTTFVALKKKVYISKKNSLPFLTWKNSVFFWKITKYEKEYKFNVSIP